MKTCCQTFPKARVFNPKNNYKVSKKSGLMMEADGESLGQAPFEITILPKALRVIVDKSYFDKS